MNVEPICSVLAKEHRDLARSLQRMAGGVPPTSREQVTDHDRFAVDLAAHLVVEDVIVQPVIQAVVQRGGLEEERRADISIIVNQVVRAGAAGSEDRFRAFMCGAYSSFVSHAERTEIGILTYVYRCFHRRDRFALAEVYRGVQSRLAERHAGALPSPGRDRSLVDVALLEELRGEAATELSPWLPAAPVAMPQPLAAGGDAAVG